MSATDTDHAVGALTWSIPAGTAGGADRARFAITSGGLLSLRAAQDYETPGDTGGDGTYEVTVQVSDGANAVTADLKVTLQDVVAVVTVAADTDTVEEGTAVVFTVTRAGDLSGALTVAVAVGETGTVLASGGSGTKQVSFADGAASATLSVATEDDATPEPGGTVTAAVQTRTGYTVGTPGRAEVTVLDNDASTVTLSAQPQEVTEAAGTIEVTVTAAWAAGRRAAATALTVRVGSSGDAATEGTDYTAVQDLTLMIAAGAAKTSGTFTLEPVNDALDESDETLTVTTALAGLTVNPASVKILDNDERGIVVQPQTLTITEGDNDRYTVALSSQPTGTVTVSPSVSGNSDVSVSAQSLTFTSGNWSATQTVTVTVDEDDDAVVEPAAVIGHQGSGGDYGTETASVTVTVVEADTPTLTIADASGREDAGTLAFVVNLSVASSAQVTVDYATADGTGTAAAAARSDYTRASGALTFAARSTAARTIAVTISDDEEAEAAEQFTVTLSAAQHATIARDTATGTITDDDAAPVITSGTAFTVAEGRTAIPNGQLSATDADHAVGELTWSIPAGTAGGADRARFALTSGGLLSLRAAQDHENPGDVDGDRVYEVTVAVSDGANAVTADLEVTLQDVVAVVTVAADTDTVEEGTAAVFTVTRAGDLSGALTVSVAVGETGTVLASGGSGTKQVSFSDGAASATLSAATEDDATPEPGGTVTAAVRSRSGYTVGTPGRAEVTVLDNDASTLTLSAQPGEVAETANATEVTVTAAWAAGRRAAATALTLEVGRATDTATEGSDYTTVQDLTLTIAAGAAQTSGTFTLAPVNDALDESDETLTVSQKTAVTGLTVNPASVKILDNDRRGIVVQPQTLTITEGERDRYTVVLSSQPTGSGSVTVSSSVSGNSDVSVSAEVLTFTSGTWSTPQTVTVTVDEDDDAVVDAAAVIGHQGSGGDYGTETARVTVTVVEADTPTLTIADASGREDAGTLAFVVNLSVASSAQVTVSYATADGTGTAAAAAGSDYTRASGTLTFAAQSTAARTIAVTISDDEEAEAAEQFTVSLSAEQHATIARGTAAGTITDDDAKPVIASGTAYTVAEGRTAIAGGQLSATDDDHAASELTWSIPAGTAGGADRARFALTNGGLLSLRAAQDYENPGDVDGDRVYEVTVAVSDGANAVTADLEVTLQDVAAVVTVAADADTVEEGTAAEFTVTRAGDLSGALTVAVAVGETGTVLASGESGTKQVSFSDGAASATLSVATEDDATPEPGGTVTAEVRTGTGYTVGTPGRAEVTVLDNDASTLTLTATPGEVAEAANATEVTVTAAWAAGRRAAATELTVRVGSSGDAATEGTDYTAVDDLTLTIAAGAAKTSGTFTLAPVNDALDENDETLTVTTAAAGLTVNPASVTILDNDRRGIVVQPETLTMTEGDDDTYTVVLTSQPTGTVTVSSSVSGNSDVSVSAEVLTFTSGTWSTPQTVTVTVDEDDDAVVDAAAVIGHQGSGGDYGTETARVTVTVVEADTPTLTIADASGREDAGTLAFVVNLSVASSAQVTVDYTTADGTGTAAAAAGSDYTRASGTLTFAAQSTTAQTIAVTISDDEEAEAAEQFTVTLSAAQHATIARAKATGTITDDDAAPVITSGTAFTVAEGRTAIANGQLSATDADHAASELTWSIPAGTAGGADRARFAITSGGLLSLRAAQDYETPGDVDGDRVYEVTVQVSDGANAVTADLEVTLRDVVAAAVTVAPAASTVEEGDAAAFEVIRAGDPSGTLTVTVEVGEVGTVLASGESGTKQVSFSDGAASATLSVATEDDATPEPGGTVTAEVRTGTGYTVGTPGSAEVTVLDNDASTVTLAVTPDEVAEDASATDVTVTAAWAAGTRAAATELTVEVGHSGDAATEGSDYATVQDLTLTIAAGAAETSGTFTLEPVDDAEDESDETLTVTTAVTGLTVNPASVKILDNDETAARALTLHVSADPDEFAYVEDAIEYTYTVTNDGTVTLVGTVTIDDDTLTGVACGELPEGGLQPAGTVTCSGTYTVVQADVDAAEVVNTATATVAEVTSPAASARVRWSAAGQQGPVLAVDPVAITEADAGLAFTVRLNPASAQTVTVSYATADVTATAGSDYTAVSGVLTFGAEETVVTVTVTVHDDAVVEPDEEFTLTLSEPSNASLASGEPTLQVIGTVRDDDERGVRVEPTELTVDPGESDTYRVVLTSRPTGDVKVTPTAPEHVTVVPPALTFGTEDWNRAQEFTVTVSSEAGSPNHVIVHATAGADYDDQPAESVTLTQRGGDGGGGGDGEIPPLQPSTSVALTLQPEQVGEGDGPTTIRVTATLDGAARDTPTEVTVAVTGATAASSDFGAVSSFPVLIAAHAASGSATFTLAPVDDALDEPDETVLVSGSVEAAGLTVHGAFVTIADDDAAPRLTIADARAVEDAGQMVFHVTLERASGRTIQVVCRSDDVSATAPDDYEAELGVLTLEPGQTAATISLKIMDDTLDEPDETLKMMLTEPSNVELADTDATGTIIDDDAAVARMWLSRFGRTVATEVVNAVDHRLRSRMDVGSQLHVAGHRVEPGAETVAAAPEVIAPGGTVQALQFQDLVAGSSFQVTPAGAGLGSGAGWAVWGSGSAAHLSGQEQDVALSGQVIGGIAGFDYDWGWMLAGLAVAHHRGSGEFSVPGTADTPADQVTVASALTSVHPYVRLAPADGVAIWGLLGYGVGGMELSDHDTGIEMKLAAFGAHAALPKPAAAAGFGLEVKSDGFLVLMNTQAPAGVAAVDAGASRVRLVLGGSLDVPLGLAGALRPSLEVGVRYDAGDAETGAGLEVGGGVSYLYPAWGLAVDANARVLLAHQDEDYREWGAGGALRVDPGTPGQGLSLGVTSSWGAAASATERLWSVRDAGELTHADLAPAGGSVAAEVGYGIALFDGAGAVTPRAAVVFDHGGRRTYRVGGSVNEGSAWSISLEGTRTEEDSRVAPTHHLTLHATLRW